LANFGPVITLVLIILLLGLVLLLLLTVFGLLNLSAILGDSSFGSAVAISVVSLLGRVTLGYGSLILVGGLHYFQFNLK
jgi:hypothetical protein